MKRSISFALLIFIFAGYASAGDVIVQAVIAKDSESEPTDTFPPEVPKLFAFFKTKGSKEGDKFRAVWIAEDVGDSAPADTKIDEATVTTDKDDGSGAVSLSKPDKGWPIGEYRVDIYAGDEVAASVKFAIKKGGKAAEPEESASDE